MQSNSSMYSFMPTTSSLRTTLLTCAFIRPTAIYNTITQHYEPYPSVAQTGTASTNPPPLNSKKNDRNINENPCENHNNCSKKLLVLENIFTSKPEVKSKSTSEIEKHKTLFEESHFGREKNDKNK